MTHTEDVHELPDGEELVLIDDGEPGSESRPDPREASLKLRRSAHEAVALSERPDPIR